MQQSDHLPEGAEHLTSGAGKSTPPLGEPEDILSAGVGRSVSLPLSSEDPLSAMTGSPASPNEEENQDADPLQPQALLAADAGGMPVVPVTIGKRPGRLKGALIALCVVLLLGGGSGLVAVLRLEPAPQPVLRLSSLYAQRSLPLGAAGTVFQASGQHFASHTAVTFLLDGKEAPGVPSLQSDNQGAIKTTLTVTSDWSPGQHTLTARDATGLHTIHGITLLIVPAGSDNTPGPHGAPTNTASITIAVMITYIKKMSGSDSLGLIPIDHFDMSKLRRNLTVSAGNVVCDSQDDGKVHTNTRTESGLTITVIFSAACSGSYHEGYFTYTETFTSYTMKTSFPPLPGGDGTIPEETCVLTQPYMAMQLEGTFTSPTTISGSATSAASTMHCTESGGLRLVSLSTGQSQTTRDDHSAAQNGTWTGTSQAKARSFSSGSNFGRL